MADGMLRLGIDLGTSNTVGCLRRGDGPVTPLLFDASTLLASGVFVAADGTVLTGGDAARAAGAHPAGFEPSPKLRIDDDTVWLADGAVPVVELLAAVLRRVGDEARRVAGEAPAETVLTCPAAWSRTRLAVLAEAARRAGLGEVGLIREPVAAAAYFAEVLGRQLPPGRCLVVYDFGAGTFDVSVVRPAADGIEVLAADGLTDVGGNDLDAVIVERLRAATPATVATADAWARLDNPESAADRRARRGLWLEARAAKEQLSRHATADVHIPLAAIDAHVTREEFEGAARTPLERTVALTVATLQAAGVRREAIGGVLLVGGSSRIPLAASLLHRALDVAPTVIEQPELVVAYGSLHTPAEVSAPPAPPPAPVAPTVPAVPAPAPVETPVPAVPAPAPVETPVPAVPAPAPVETPVIEAPRPRRRLPLLAAALAALLLMAGGVVLWNWQHDSARAGSGAENGAGSGASPTGPPLTSVERRAPGCAETDLRVHWDPVQGDRRCSADAVTVTKQVGWDSGGYLRSYAELRLSIPGQTFPEAYTVDFKIGGLSGPSRDPAVTRGGCGGLAVHTSPDGRAYDYFNVCGDGWIELVPVPDNSKLGQPSQKSQVTPVAAGGFYAVTVQVSAKAVVVRVDNGAGDSRTVSSAAVASTTSYIGLMTTWRDAGATASFSDFRYHQA